MKFQIGKYYQHGSGRVISIIGQANTFFHGACLIAEEEVGRLIPVGTDEDAAQHWREVSGWRRYCYAGNNIPEPSEPLSQLLIKMKTSTTERSPLGSDTCSASLARGIAALEAEIQPLADSLQKLKRQKREVDSRDFIAANRITREDVEMSSGDKKPWFGTVWLFGEWLAGNSKKVWAEWNGRIYHAADLVNGRKPDMPGETDHLPNVTAHPPHGQLLPDPHGKRYGFVTNGNNL